MKNEPFVNVHICNLAAQTGVTRFTQIHDHWTYSKNESLQPEQLQDYTHLILEAKSKYSPNLKAFSQTHVILDSVDTFSQVAVNYKLLPPIRIKTKPALFILERKDFREYPQGHNLYTIDSPEIDDENESIEDISEESIARVVNNENEVNDVEEKIYSVDYENVVDHLIENPIGIDDVQVPEEVVVVVEDDYIPPVKEEQDVKKITKAKKAIDDIKIMRQERKRKAISKIKTETRKEVVASAKEKLKELMKRHKHIAAELSENIITNIKIDADEKDGRGDIPETEIVKEIETASDDATVDLKDDTTLTVETIDTKPEDIEPVGGKKTSEEVNRTNENINVIVEEVIARLIDRKIYDDKTKPEDIKSEDRQIIQKIVEEILSERMNYNNSGTM